MTEEDCEIEYLDEDEDLIQQFVQVAPTVNAPVAKKKTTTKKAPAVEKKPTRITRSSRKALDENAYEEENTNSLLEERSEVKRKLRSEEDSEAIEELSQVVKIRKKNDAIVENAPVVGKQPTRTTDEIKPKKHNVINLDEDDDDDANILIVKKKHSDVKPIPDDDDTDYDPVEDLRQAMKKRKKVTKTPKKNIHDFTRQEDTKTAQLLFSPKFDLKERRKKGIRIPDFEDPLCLPVKALCHCKEDMKMLKSWNKICLEQYKKNFDPFRPSEDPVVSSTRTTVFRKIRNKSNGQVHTSLWHKLQVKDKNGKEKSEVYQNTLPYFREKILLKPFSVIKANPQRFRNKHEVLLSKEVNKDEEYLVAYNPGDAVSAVYKYFNQSDTLTEGDDRKPRLVIKEASCNKICAPCYQTSWRGVRKRENASIQCVICKRTFVTVYNLLSHLKTHHKNEEVRSHKAALARSLAKAVDYHYKCRICQETFLSIKLLRKHVNRHQADEPLEFHCEIGNHIAK